MNEEFYTISEVAKILKVCRRTIERSIKKGRILSFKVNSGLRSSVRIPKTELGRIQVMDLDATVTNLISMRKE